MVEFRGKGKVKFQIFLETFLKSSKKSGLPDTFFKNVEVTKFWSDLGGDAKNLTAYSTGQNKKISGAGSASEERYFGT